MASQRAARPPLPTARASSPSDELAKAYLDVQACAFDVFRGAEARVRDQPLRRLTQAAVELCATAEGAASIGAARLHRTTQQCLRWCVDADERDVGYAVPGSDPWRLSTRREVAGAEHRVSALVGPGPAV